MSKVRRLTTPRLEPTLEIRVSEPAECVLGLYQSGWLMDPGETELGQSWFGDLRTVASPALARLIAIARESGVDEKAMHDLVALTAEAGSDMATFLDRMRTHPELARFAELLDSWHSAVFAARWPEIRSVLERDAQAKRRLAGSASVADVLEEASNGGEYVAEVGVERVILQPCYVLRPWLTHAQLGRDLVMCYPVADDALAPTDDEAQRGRILRLTKALGDDTRLRALRLLSNGRWTLQELADQLGVQKSTMHHHIAVLRAAGLLRMRLGEKEKRYSLRSLPLAQASPLLRAYLGWENRR